MPKEMNIFQIPIEMLEPHPGNPRKDLGDLSELVESIKANGILQNLTVVPHPENTDKFRVVIGHRRLEAARLTGTVTSLPCVISDMDEQEQAATMLAENMQRSNLTAYEQAWGFQQLSLFGWSTDQIAEKSGFSVTTVKRRLKMAELDPKTLKEVSEGRQLSLMDFDKLAEIEDIGERNNVLKSIGTADFNQELSKAQVRQKVAARLPEVKEWLKTHHAKKLTRQESWSNRYEGFKGKHYYGCIYIDKFGESGNTFPTDKEIGDTELFYLLEERTVSLHQKRSTPKRDQKSEEQKNKERAQRANKKEARELAEMCFNLRKQFVDGLALTKQNTDAVLMGATKLISYYCQSHSQWHSDGVSELLGLGKFEYGKKVKERVQKIEKGEALKLIYACFGDSPTTFPGSMQTPDSFVSYDTSFGFEIVLLYDWLVSMGYEMSTEEKAMMDGTHSVFKAEEAYYGQAK